MNTTNHIKNKAIEIIKKNFKNDKAFQERSGFSRPGKTQFINRLGDNPPLKTIQDLGYYTNYIPLELKKENEFYKSNIHLVDYLRQFNGLDKITLKNQISLIENWAKENKFEIVYFPKSLNTNLLQNTKYFLEDICNNNNKITLDEYKTIIKEGNYISELIQRIFQVNQS